jgi:hypothetical protein
MRHGARRSIDHGVQHLDKRRILGRARCEQCANRATAADACRVRANTQDDNAPLRENWRANRAPAEPVAEIHRQLNSSVARCSVGTRAARSGLCQLVGSPIRGAVHFWNPGVRSWQATHEMTQPFDDFTLVRVRGGLLDHANVGRRGAVDR